MAARLVLCAGIPRSGSTWLYNAVRLSLEAADGGEVYGTWVADYDPATAASCHVIKIHDPCPQLAAAADRVLTSRRDLRDVAASVRARGWARTDDELIEFLKHVVEIHGFWKARSIYEVVYERMIDHRPQVIAEVAEVLGLALARDRVIRVDEQIRRLRHDDAGQPYDKVSLLHRGHVGPGRPGAYAEVLDQRLVRRINEQFGSWLRDHDYNDTREREAVKHGS